MRLRRGDPPRAVPQGWPKWEMPCRAFSWQTGKPCKNPAVRGTNQCGTHGGRGLNRIQGWKRYLLWVLLPETVRYTKLQDLITDEFVQVACQALAEEILTGDRRLSERARMAAVEYLFESQALEMHPDPALLLTHLSREDAQAAIRILRLNHLIH